MNRKRAKSPNADQDEDRLAKKEKLASIKDASQNQCAHAESKDKVAPHAKSKNPSASILSLDEIQRKTVLSIASRTESVTKLILRNLTETTHKKIRGAAEKGLKSVQIWREYAEEEKQRAMFEIANNPEKRLKMLKFLNLDRRFALVVEYYINYSYGRIEELTVAWNLPNDRSQSEIVATQVLTSKSLLPHILFPLLFQYV